MKATNFLIKTTYVLAAILLAQIPALSQSVIPSHRPLSANIIVPQSRIMTTGLAAAVRITNVRVRAEIFGQAATTCMEIDLENPTHSRQEAEFLVPVPDGAVVRGFNFQGMAEEPTARLLPKDEARALYNRIVARERDPALLEFAGYNCIRSSVFPLEPRGTQRVQLIYDHLLPADGLRVDYCLPRTESLSYNLPWEISVTIRSKTPIATVYSPTHFVRVRHGQVQREGGYKDKVLAEVAPDARLEPGSFLLTFLLEAKDKVSASLMAYPDPKVGGGYFLLLADLPPAKGQRTLNREVTLVLDRSGSMKGEKLKQARRAAKKVIESLRYGEAFNILTYSDHVDLFSETAVIKTPESLFQALVYIDSIETRGGTNIYDALFETLRIRPSKGTIPIAFFLTDGLPTLGETSEKAIRKLVKDANPHNRRIFSFGVGVDVNTPLLDKIAGTTRGTAEFVLPGQKIDDKVARVFSRLSGPVLAMPEIKVTGLDGNPMPGRVRDMLPHALPDFYENDQLVLLGTYMGDAPLRFRLTGKGPEGSRTFHFTLGVDQATRRNSFVPRLWASRKIATLVDAIRDSGAELSPAAAALDPRFKELVDEIVNLSLEFGILTEYTSFFANEGTNLMHRDRVLTTVMDNFSNRALGVRSGWAAVNQELNMQAARGQSKLNRKNSLFDTQMRRVTQTEVQQVNDLAFYRQGARWVDSRVMNLPSQTPQREVSFGESGFNEALEQLEAEQRQGAISLPGEKLMIINGELVLVRPIPGK